MPGTGIITFIIVLFVIFLIFKIFKLSLELFFKLLLNALIGAVILFIFNYVFAGLFNLPYSKYPSTGLPHLSQVFLAFPA